jgi:hypothetical protein
MGDQTTELPSTRDRSSSGTQSAPGSPITHASTLLDATPSWSPTAVRNRRVSLAV